MTRLYVPSVLLTLSLALGAPRAAFAQPHRAVGASALAPPPYSLPWQLRPVTAGNLVRVDSTAAGFNDANGNLDLALASVLTVSYRLRGHWAPMLRLGFVGNNAPGAAHDGGSFANPVVGATYAREFGSYRLALFGATTIPVGLGGGNAPNPAAARAATASTTARPADDAMFAVNYLTPIFGVDFAYVNHGFTAQLEVTVQPMFRVRGDQNAAATDSFRMNAAAGLHLGCFIGSHVSLGADLRYQRWLSHPTTPDAANGAHVPITGARMDTVTVALGLRLHFNLGGHANIHPGLSLTRGFDARGFDAPLVTAETTAVQIDIPVFF